MRVVVVDPSPNVLQSIERLLATRNHEVSTFLDAGEALEYLKCDPNVGALITNDELRPGSDISGIELCWEGRLVASCRRPIYIILMSCDRDPKKLIEALDSGADDFIGNPPIAEELYARLRSAERLANMQQELLRLALTDPLTGVLNRRAFFERAVEVCGRAGDLDALSAIVIDVDHFKRINDLYGHDIGDTVIRKIAEAITTEPAIIGRLGGEEFAMVLEGRDLAAALGIAARLRTRVARLRAETEGAALKLTCSFGVSEWQPGDTIDLLLKRADIALYAAKTGGRNRVVAFDRDLIEAGDYNAASRRVRNRRSRRAALN
jgi:two-component system, cell cycle response regulator